MTKPGCASTASAGRICASALQDYPPQRVAAITGIPAEQIVALARRYGTTKPALLKFADGIQRHGNGGQTCRALACAAGGRRPDRRARWRALLLHVGLCLLGGEALEPSLRVPARAARDQHEPPRRGAHRRSQPIRR